MRNVRIAGNRVFLEEHEELVEVWSGGSESPAHHSSICCWALSPNEQHLITLDQGGQIKIWDLQRRRGERRVWDGAGFADATAVATTNGGQRLAVAHGLTVKVYKTVVLANPWERDKLVPLGTMDVPLEEKVVSLTFEADNQLLCRDVRDRIMAFWQPEQPPWQRKIL